jgi:hypothetical protein
MQEARNGRWSSVIVHCSFVLFPLMLLWRPLFAGEAFHWGTPLLQFVPWQRMAAEMWRGGHLPLWNPLVGCGAPLAANYQTAAFYPLNALYLLLPAEVALTWTTVLHLALAGWGMYRWGRAVGLGRFAALIGALALEGSGFLVARVALFPSMAFTFPWIAVWLWRGEALVQRRRFSDALWLGLALGLGLLAGHAQVAFYGGALLAGYLVFRMVQVARGRRQEAGSKGQDVRDKNSRITHHASRFTSYVSRSLALAVLSLILGLALSAIQLLPTAELMLQSQRATGVDYDFAMTNSLWPWRLITFIAPDFFGNPGYGNYWGYNTYWEDTAYVGLLPLLLAAGVTFRVVFRRTRGPEKQVFAEAVMARFWVVCAIVALVLALGQNTPIFPFLFRYVPSFDLFQAPARWLAVTTVALAALAGLAAQRWPAGRFRQRRGALGIVFGGAFLIAGLAAPLLIPDERLVTFGAATLRLGVTLVGVGLLVLLWQEKPRWRVAVVGFVFLDLLLFGWPLVPTVDRSLYQGSTQVPSALGQERDAVRVYWPTDLTHRNREYDAENRVKFDYLRFSDFGSRDVDYWWGMREALIPNAGMLDGVSSANNFDPLLGGRYVDLLSAAMSAPSLLRVMGVTHVISDQSWSAEPIYATDDATLYRLPDALSRAWIVPSARQVSPDEMLTTLADPDFDPTDEVLLEAPVSSFQSPIPNPQSLALQDTPNRVTIHAALDAPGYLVLADAWYPGWQAMVDGEPVELLRANYAFRAVWLEAGEHSAEMVYRPASVLVGGVVSLVAVICIVIGLVLERKQEARE